MMRDVFRRAARMLLAGLMLSSAAARAATPPLSGDIPVPGGRMALARALHLDTPPDRARFVSEIARLVYSDSSIMRASDESAFRRIHAYFADSRPSGATADGDRVPIALPTLWTQAIFRRPIADTDLFAAVMSDRSAALLAYGLAALDDETLAYLALHPALAANVYRHHAARFAAFAGHVHIHAGRVALPGGERAVGIWEALVGERVAAPDRFLLQLFGRSGGRLAYLFDTIAHLDRPRAAFALGLWMSDPQAQIERFLKLADVVSSSFPEWRVDQAPFRRPVNDLVSLLVRITPASDGAPGPPASRLLWSAVFMDQPARAEGDLPDAPIDAAWLAAATFRAAAADRRSRLDSVAFGMRVFTAATPTSYPAIGEALRAFPNCPMLMLTLERAGVRDPLVYAEFAVRARAIADLAPRHRRHALGQLQGAIAIVDRLVRVHTIDRGRAEALLRSLAALRVDGDGFAGAVARWLRVDLRPVLPDGPSVEDALTRALAGRPAASSPRIVTFEGEKYRLDVAAAEVRRIQRIRALQQTASLDAALQTDGVLADVLIAFAYAANLPDGDGTVRFAANLARRHDFGLAAVDRTVRDRAPWAMAKEVFSPGESWHVEGAALGLDITFAAMTLKRLASAPPSRAPALSAPERDAFAMSLAQLDRFALQDRDRDEIVAAIDQGRRRVQTLTRDRDAVEPLLHELGVDGWRIRAFRRTLDRDTDAALLFFSLSELVALGGGATRVELDRWAMTGNSLLGCLCQYWSPPAMARALAGRPSAGLIASTVVDLNLRVAEVLHALDVPAALEPAVLAVALQDFVDRVAPVDGDDWITFVRTAQGVSRELIEDAVAAAAADGPLVRLRGGVRDQR